MADEFVKNWQLPYLAMRSPKLWFHWTCTLCNFPVIVKTAILTEGEPPFAALLSVMRQRTTMDQHWIHSTTTSAKTAMNIIKICSVLCENKYGQMYRFNLSYQVLTSYIFHKECVCHQDKRRSRSSGMLHYVDMM